LTVLYIFLFILIIIILLLCIRVIVMLDYNEKFVMDIEWIFFKFRIFPKKKKIKEKTETENENKQKKETKTKTKTKKRSNPFLKFYENQGVSGVLELIKNTSAIISGMLKRTIKSVIINKLDLRIVISSGDAASTAIEYGKICSEVFPALGIICSNLKVKKQNVNIMPDFICSENKAQFNVVLSISPLRVINACVIMCVQFIFNVFLKFIIGSRNIKKI